MKIKRLSAVLLALVLCMSCLSMTAFAYSDESAAATEPTAETESVVEPTAPVTEDSEDDKTSEELPYNFTVTEDGKIIFSFNGEEYEYDMETEETTTKGKVVTGGSRLNVRTGAGMNYEIIDQLRPGEEVVVIGTEGDWYEITVPEKHGYVHGDYLEIIEAAQGNNEMDMALMMMFMSMFQNMDFDAVCLSVGQHKCDIAMAGLTINEEREEYVTFSDPYYKASQRLVTLADDTAFDDCKDAASVEEVLKGLSASDKIGGQQGTTAQYFVEGSDDWGFEGLPAEWVPYKSASLAVQDMINGNVKYVIIDAAPAESITKAINAMQ